MRDMHGMEGMNARIKGILKMDREPVGVKFLKENDLLGLKDDYDSSTKMRYCQALMRAGRGEKVIVTAANIACPASAAAFGLKPLPDMLSSGQMLYSMGLFATPEAGAKAMSGMPRLPQHGHIAVLLGPLGSLEMEPDVVVFESKPEHLMWLALASIYESGERLESNSAIFQATCVDSTVIPFTTGRLNSTLGCYGCREATDVTEEENLVGIPFAKVGSITDNLEKLAGKPMVRARAKEAFRSFGACGEMR